MNRLMWANPATRDNVRRLAARGVALLGPGTGDQACGETGDGPDARTARDRRRAGGRPGAGDGALAGRGCRHGRTDARGARPGALPDQPEFREDGLRRRGGGRRAGAEVVLVSGPVDLSAPAGVRVVQVETAAQMRDAVHAELPGTAVFIGAAVADYRPARPAPQKLKKHAGEMALDLVRNPDILAEVAAPGRAPSWSASRPRPRTSRRTRASSSSASRWT
jgi:phosphopantothenoylcysteine decarboxylase / phosphopantothenate---cysteine ligase